MKFKKSNASAYISSSQAKALFYFTVICLVINILTIVGGGLVRATHSGHGCGSSWPLCNNFLIPDFQMMKTVIEFTHRMMSSLVLLTSIALLVWSARVFSRSSIIFKSNFVFFIFVLLEALLGAGLVIFGLVDKNSSISRVVMVGLHLINSFFLVSSLTVSAQWSFKAWKLAEKVSLPGIIVKKRKILKRTKILLFSLSFLFVSLFMGITGAITALGDTLFLPSEIGAEFWGKHEGELHFLQMLRIYHPMVAILGGMYLLWSVWHLHERAEGLRKYAVAYSGLFFVQVTTGFLNIYLFTPLFLQMLHLLFANFVFVVLALYVEHLLFQTEAKKRLSLVG